MRTWPLAVAVVGPWVVIPACSNSDDIIKSCRVNYTAHGSTTAVSFCAKKATCDDYCARTAGHSEYEGCHLADVECSNGSGTEDKPPPVASARYCALTKKTGCGSDFQNASAEPFCDESCSISPGSTDTDQLGSTTCYTRYGDRRVEGTSCQDALSKL